MTLNHGRSPKLSSKKKEQAFRQIFIQNAYDSMAMENEAVFSKKEMMQRYRVQMDALIKEGAHKRVIIPAKYAKNETNLPKH